MALISHLFSVMPVRHPYGIVQFHVIHESRNQERVLGWR